MVDASYKGNTSQIDRLNRLTEKLNNSTLDSPKNSKFEFLTSRIGDLNNHLDEIVAQTAKKFGIIKENINLIAKQLDEENQKAENLLESKNHYIKLLEQKITERFNQESQIRDEIGKKLFTVIDDKFNALKVEVSKESMNRYECIENLKSYLENDVPKLNEMVTTEQEKREEGDEIIAKRTNEEIQKIQEVIANDKKTREETEEAILEMLRIMITKTKTDIEAERKDREQTEETLLSLLEDTCNKLGNSSQI